LNTKEDIFNNVGNQTVDCTHSRNKKYYGSQRGQLLYQHYSAEERHSYKFGTTLGSK